jgi:Cof subfamily protein (haloacid dehalogenase superfamily)
LRFFSTLLIFCFISGGVPGEEFPVQYHLLVLDVDGTLLDSRHILRPRVAARVREVAASGLRVLLATGKLLASVRPLLEEMSLSGPQIVLNGAATCDGATGTPLRFRPLASDACRTIIGLARSSDPDVLVSRFGLDAIFMDRPHERSGIFAEYGEIAPVLVPDLLADDLPPTAKILFHGTHHQLNALRASLSPKRLPEGVIVTSTTPDFLEYFDARAGKGPALAELRSQLDISREAVIAIGDGENDIPLFAEAGLAIAMGNASAATKAAAARIAPSNDEEGVAVVLEALLAATA